MPERIQLRRTKGWRLPEGAVNVARPSRWGNPFVVHAHTELCGVDLVGCHLVGCHVPGNRRVVDTADQAVTSFRHMLQMPTSSDPRYPDLDEIRWHLAGRDLACWCPLDQPCHADVLLALANGDPHA